jgi:hypothetical protein
MKLKRLPGNSLVITQIFLPGMMPLVLSPRQPGGIVKPGA